MRKERDNGAKKIDTGVCTENQMYAECWLVTCRSPLDVSMGHTEYSYHIRFYMENKMWAGHWLVVGGSPLDVLVGHMEYSYHVISGLSDVENDERGR